MTDIECVPSEDTEQYCSDSNAIDCIPSAGVNRDLDFSARAKLYLPAIQEERSQSQVRSVACGEKNSLVDLVRKTISRSATDRDQLDVTRYSTEVNTGFE